MMTIYKIPLRSLPPQHTFLTIYHYIPQSIERESKRLCVLFSPQAAENSAMYAEGN